MEQEIKVIKKLFLYGSILFILLLLTNAMEAYIKINSPFISNNLVLTIIGGIYTGITAVLLEKLITYHLNKSATLKNMYYDSIMLYSYVYYWICNIQELMANRTLFIPENLFSNNIPNVSCYINRINCYNYSTFWGKDFVQQAHEKFRKQDSNSMNAIFAKMNYLPIAINQAQIFMLQTGFYKSDSIYQVLSIVEKDLLIYMEKLGNLIFELSKADKSLDWNKDKDIILTGYHGVYSQTLDEFIKANISHTQSDTTSSN